MADEISDVDLCAYVDDELDMARRVEVEDYLSRHPEAAAAVMADFKRRDELKLLRQAPDRTRPELLERAGKLDRKLRNRRLARMMPRLGMAAAVLLVIGLAQDELGELFSTRSEAAPVPAFVDEAAETHETALIRATYEPSTLNARIDGAAIRAATRIVFPRMPASWRVRDVQLVPTDEGTALQIAVSSDKGVPMTFFAVRTTDSAPNAPTVSELDGPDVAYWKRGEVGYALAGSLSSADLHREAEGLAGNPLG